MQQELERKNPKEALSNCLKKIEDKIRNKFKIINKSGSCALIVLINQDKAWIANIGDSRLLSISKDKNVVQITNDHKP